MMAKRVKRDALSRGDSPTRRAAARLRCSRRVDIVYPYDLASFDNPQDLGPDTIEAQVAGPPELPQSAPSTTLQRENPAWNMADVVRILLVAMVALVVLGAVIVPIAARKLGIPPGGRERRCCNTLPAAARICWAGRVWICPIVVWVSPSSLTMASLSFCAFS